MTFYCILDEFVIIVPGMFVIFPIVQITSFAGLLL
jgi:hypothetical protein